MALRNPPILGLVFLLLAVFSTVEARVCGTRFVEHYRQRFPLPAAKLLAPEQEEGEITLGTQLHFLVFNRFSLVPATCRYVGEHAYIFVEDAQWDTNGGPVVQQDVDELGELFERSTPSDLDRGIYSLEVEAFGAPADVDGDERIFILILDVDPSSRQVDAVGFFDPWVATHADPQLRRDTLYLDATVVRRARYLARGTLAHEFQHLIHWAHDDDEEVWVDEGLAGYAEELVGFPEADPAVVPAFLKRPDIDLTAWHKQAYNYGSTYLFMSFLAEKYGAELIRRMVEAQGNGILGIDEAFANSGLDQDFEGGWKQWIAANYGGDTMYGYAALQGRQVLAARIPPPPPEGRRLRLLVGNRWGTSNILIRAEGGIKLDFSGERDKGYRVWLYTMGNDVTRLEELVLDDENKGRVEVINVDSLALVVGLTSFQGGLFEILAQASIPTAIRVQTRRDPVQASDLGAVYPNPFNGFMRIPFHLSAAGSLELSLYNVLGQQIRVLQRGFHQAGRYEAVWDGRNGGGSEVGSGTYLVVLQTGSGRVVQRISLVR